MIADLCSSAKYKYRAYTYVCIDRLNVYIPIVMMTIMITITVMIRSQVCSRPLVGIPRILTACCNKPLTSLFCVL